MTKEAQKANGTNSTPTDKEIENCSTYLKKTLEIISPDIIVTLGRKALSALKNIQHHNIVLRNSVAEIQSWNGKCLLPLYHPSPTSINFYRSMQEQMTDFAKLLLFVDPIGGFKVKKVV